MKTKTIWIALLGFVLASFVQGADLQVVYEADPTKGDSGALAGTQKCLQTNAPDGSWWGGGGWEWSYVHATGSAINLGEEHAQACLPLMSTNDFVVPATVTVTAKLYHHQGRGGVGFWPEQIPPSIVYKDENNKDVFERYNGKTGFSGITLDQCYSNGNLDTSRSPTLRLAINGQLVGDSIVVTSAGKYDELAISVNLATGDLIGVFFNGEAIQGFPETQVFTGDAVKYVGLCSWDGGRTEAQSFRVVEASLEAFPEIFVDPATTMSYTNNLVQVRVSARRSDTREALPTRIVSFDGDENYTFEEGVFQWTSTTAGVYTVVFETELEEETVQASSVLTVMDPPDIDTSVIYVVDARGDYQGEVENTDMAILTNQPGAVWSVGGGWEWATPRANGSNFNLGEEKACVYLPVFNTNAYIRPNTLTITATLDDQDRDADHGLGFWATAIPRSKFYEEAGGTLRYTSTDGFSGIILNQIKGTARLVINGQSKGSPVPIDSTRTQYQKLSFTIDTRSGELLYATFNEERILGLPETTGFTEAATQYAGVLSWAGGRVSFQEFSLTEGRPASRVPIMTITPRTSTTYAGFETVHTIMALDPDTFEPVPVSITDFEGGESVSFVDGVLRWTPTHPGTYTVHLRASIEDDHCDKELTLEVLPLIPVYTLPPEVSAFVGESIQATVIAQNPGNLTNTLVEVVSFEGPDYRFANDTFSCSITTPGAYTATFRTELDTPYGSEVVVTNIPFLVFRRPDSVSTGTIFYQTDFTGVASSVKIAGDPISKPETRTSAALGINLPEAVWIWGSGYNWGVPQTRESGSRIDLGENICALFLPIHSTNSYVRPAKLQVKTTFSTLYGNGLVGFWSHNAYELTQNDTLAYQGFTGFRFNSTTRALQLYADGQPIGEPQLVPFANDSDGFDFSFVINSENGSVSDVCWEGFALEPFPECVFTPEATPYVGVGLGDVHDNPGNAKSSGRISFFQVAEPKPRATCIFFR